MPSPISVYIEMPTYLKKYLIFQSKNKEEPIVFSEGHNYNLLLTRLISNDRRIKPSDKSKKGCKIILPFNQFKDVYFYNKLSKKAKQKFRNQLRDDFLYDFRMFLKDRTVSFFDRKQVMEFFFLTMKITDDDINYASFYRSFTRYNEKRRVTYSKSMLTQSLLQIVRF